jgi:AraC-like DNA-binding protein
MNNQDKNTSFIKSFFSDKLNFIIYSSSFIILIVFYFVHFKKGEFKIYPSTENTSVHFYNDSIDGGNSKIVNRHFSNSMVQIEFVLQKGFVRPYVGINFLNNNENNIDVSAYNQIRIDAETKDLQNLIVYLVTHNGNELQNKELYFSNNIDFESSKTTFDLNLSDFKIPDWWYDVNNLSPKQNISPDWTQFNKINIATGLPPKLGTKHQFTIRSISFIRNNTGIIILFIAIQIAIMLLLLLYFWYKIKTQKNKSSITIIYKPVAIQEESSKKHLQYINEHFQDSTLNLEVVSLNTGMSQRNISDAISEQFGCNFKTYINQIRIKEAQRLLKETKLNSSEIAYSVGFSSPNNFNRVFKNLTGKNPSEYVQSNE